MTGSRMIMFGLAMSMRARKVQAPSGNSPAFMLLNSAKFSSMLRLLYGLFLPASVGVPFSSAISSAVL
jgi:hypothetical protein